MRREKPYLIPLVPLAVLVFAVLAGGCAHTGARRSGPDLPELEDVPTHAEVEAAKAMATAETALEISRRAEEGSRAAREESAQALATSEKAIEASENAVAKANESIEKVNQSIDRINEINREIRRELARVEHEWKTEVQRTRHDLGQEMLRLKHETEQDIAEMRHGLARREREQEEEIRRLRDEIMEMTISLPDVYTVRRSDYLIKIAAREDIYGDSTHWRRIFEANRDKIRNPNLIFPGQTLVIPR